MRRHRFRTAVFLAVLAALGTAAPSIAQAVSYRTSFENANIAVAYPLQSPLECDGTLRVEGTSKLSTVYFCLRGPQGELVTYAVPVSGGRFALKAALRFGPGTYTVWAGDNPRRFDGSVRFQVTNTQAEDQRYLAPSFYVDSDHPAVRALAARLTASAASQEEKLRSIYDWVTKNIACDYRAYLAGASELHRASEILAEKKGLCRDYAFVVAALARAAGLPARVIYGEVKAWNGWEPQKHAWNEVLADGRWVSLDATWGAGYVRDGRFVSSPSPRFLDPQPAEFAETHLAPQTTLH